MRKANLKLTDVIEEIKALKGKKIAMSVNRGRKTIESYEGVLEKIYPSVFTVDIFKPDNKGKQSYSYSDVLCGDVVIKHIEETSSEAN